MIEHDQSCTWNGWTWRFLTFSDLADIANELILGNLEKTDLACMSRRVYGQWHNCCVGTDTGWFSANPTVGGISVRQAKSGDFVAKKIEPNRWEILFIVPAGLLDYVEPDCLGYDL